MTSLPFTRILLLTLRTALANPDAKVHATLAHLLSLDIPATPFTGYDCSESGLITTHPYERDHPGSGYRIGPKTVNMCLSHLTMWRSCELLEGTNGAQPSDSFLFLEDDVRFRPDWYVRFSRAFAALPPSWDLLYVGSCCCADKQNNLIAPDLYRVRYALCTHAYAVRRKALSVLQAACARIYAGIDISMCLHGIPKLETYAILPRVADQFETVISP